MGWPNALLAKYASIEGSRITKGMDLSLASNYNNTHDSLHVGVTVPLQSTSVFIDWVGLPLLSIGAGRACSDIVLSTGLGGGGASLKRVSNNALFHNCLWECC